LNQGFKEEHWTDYLTSGSSDNSIGVLLAS